MISQMLALPAKFLGPDTAICSYGDLQLKTTADLINIHGAMAVFHPLSL